MIKLKGRSSSTQANFSLIGVKDTSALSGTCRDLGPPIPWDSPPSLPAWGLGSETTPLRATKRTSEALKWKQCPRAGFFSLFSDFILAGY